MLDLNGAHVDGDAPTKEALLHLAMYRARGADGAVVHLHSGHAVAVSVLADLDPADVLPPLTAYQAMRVGALPLLPYFAPGDRALADAVSAVADRHHALLLANYGPIVSGSSLAVAPTSSRSWKRRRAFGCVCATSAFAHLRPRNLPILPCVIREAEEKACTSSRSRSRQ